VIDSEGIRRPFLKIDAEGQEGKILADLITRTDVDDLSGIVELHPDKMPERTVGEVEEMMGNAEWRFDFIVESSPEYKEDRPIYYFEKKSESG
jgi:hypothetical protein